jgi:hypothetical protein
VAAEGAPEEEIGKMGGETFGRGLVRAAGQAREYAAAEPELWYVRVRGRVTVAECRMVEKFRIYSLPGEAISKTYYLGDDPGLLADNPEIEFVRLVPDLDDIEDAAIERDLAE